MIPPGLIGYRVNVKPRHTTLKPAARFSISHIFPRSSASILQRRSRCCLSRHSFGFQTEKKKATQDQQDLSAQAQPGTRTRAPLIFLATPSFCRLLGPSAQFLPDGTKRRTKRMLSPNWYAAATLDCLSKPRLELRPFARTPRLTKLSVMLINRQDQFSFSRAACLKQATTDLASPILLCSSPCQVPVMQTFHRLN